MIRRDVQPDNKQIPLPIEMVYNSFSDAITYVDPVNGFKSYFRDDPAHFNRIYFKYPPEWKTSNIGEKIIGVRNMKISIRKRMQLEFTLYIRKYKQQAFDDLSNVMFPGISFNDLNDDQIQDVVDRINNKDIHVYKIDYINDIFDNVDDFIEDLYESIDDENIYNYLRFEILESEGEPDDKIGELEQLDLDKDNYDIMCLRNDIPFYLNNHVDGIYYVKDVDVREEIGKRIELTFGSPQNEYEQFYIDFMMTAINDDSTYKKFYDWDDDKNEPLPNQVLWPGVLDNTDRFESDTAAYFNIGTTNPNRNSLEYVTKFHKELIFCNVMTNLQCEVAASFATQSNHNLIGRTNEMYEPIKYYKINDNDDKFWIEFYDRNEINIPIAFNDFVMFTMDVVFLQNRKLLYS